MDPWCICLMFVATAWMDSHPGGKEILLLAAGRDITYAFDSYHPFTEKPEQGTVLPVGHTHVINDRARQISCGTYPNRTRCLVCYSMRWQCWPSLRSAA